MNTTARSPAGLTWLRGAAIAALLTLPASVLVVRLGWWQPGLLLYAAACLVSVAALALAVIAGLLPRLRRHRGALLTPVLAALPGSVLLATVLAGRGDHPPIHDISTDLTRPPVFSHAPALRGREANSLEPNPQTHAAQRAAYADIQPLRSSLAPEAAYARAVTTAEQLGWEVVYQAPRKGELEAVATTPIMGFKDDVAIRLRPSGDGGTRVDLRSVSRVGVGDLGANAARIRAFIEQYSQGE
ncbi:DUF1499 domain-containing protein [Parahaliea mediterranea]|uniref:DUF1499 domain-containing protein n=1 Tax=Parahaliea mediterranea TaxID=651086 RepID=A0A939DJZ6_9GAMM|nr:DUF1499 domain-containing protein [Parahaliea mediterranea]MBN7798892.1 DUF1499 domain-containing protein [Parahaliea mediterranea]